MSDFDAASQLLTYPRPDPTLLPADRADAYRRSAEAATAVYRGMTVRESARLHTVNRGTLTAIMKIFDKLAPDGQPWGFRACIPWRRRATEVEASRITIPPGPAPHAFLTLLLSLKILRELLEEYRGDLPARHRRSRRFDAMFKKFKQLLVQANAEKLYPLNTPDKGRRALIRHLRATRQKLLTADLTRTGDDTESPLHLSDLLALAPLDRVEVDGHKTDVHWKLIAPGKDGNDCLVDVPTLWLFVMIDAVSRVVYAWHLVVARKYRQEDLLELHAKALTPWAPRDLVSPTMHYHPQAWMPSQGQSASEILRVACDAMDNDSGHTSKLSTDRLASSQLGVVNLGPAGIPQTRPHVEAFFRMIEERVYRRLAGGFRPAGNLSGEETAANRLNANDYPLDLLALHDLMDVVISAYNISPHDGLQQRTPREVHEAHLRTLPWVNRCSRTADHARDFRTLRKKVWIRGSKKDGVLPHVHWEHGTYRSLKLNGRWDLIGTAYMAEMPSNEPREVQLFDVDTGELAVTLRVLAPWNRTPHDVATRRRAHAWRDRGVLKYDVYDDAIEAYHDYVRKNAWRDPQAAEAAARHQLAPPTTSPSGRARAALGAPLAGVIPRTGPVSFVRPRRNS